MRKIVLSEPNISEGRDLDLVEKVADEVRKVEGVKLIDYSSDSDHNRSVLTYLGEPAGVLDATKAMAAKAVDLIDMRHHQGSHPRLGAVDVVPFIPIRGIDSEETVELARAFGEYLGGLGVPVYFYEDAATRPERKTLPKIRKGQYEGLEEKMKNPDWLPDAGPHEFSAKSGATVTGVRISLVAFNVNLRTTDVSIADRIARSVRFINGGYRFVRALGLPLEEQGMVQVSMNLVNYEKTPIHRVLETIKFEAARYGVAVAGTELIGSLPLAALDEVIRYYLQAHDFSMDQVVETALID